MTQWFTLENVLITTYLVVLLMTGFVAARYTFRRKLYA